MEAFPIKHSCGYLWGHYVGPGRTDSDVYFRSKDFRRADGTTPEPGSKAEPCQKCGTPGWGSGASWKILWDEPTELSDDHPHH